MLNLRFLPHYFKFIGLSLFVISVLGSFLNGFFVAHEHLPYGSQSDAIPPILLSKEFHVLQYLGILIYVFAKDKVFDEFMFKLRLESLFLVFFGTILFFSFQVYFKPELKIEADYLFDIQVLSYFFINKLFKGSITPES